jgi:hypothetical protein
MTVTRPTLRSVLLAFVRCGGHFVFERLIPFLSTEATAQLPRGG